ncbi:POL4 protein, partial [Pseudoatta argentina]
MLEGRNFHVIADHKPLIYAFKKKSEQMSPRQTRHLLFISEFTTDVRHVSGAENIVADALSRADTIVMPTSLDMQEIAEAQASDNELQQLKQSTSTRVFDMVHQMSHPSGRATHRQITQKFVWPSMAKDIKEWARICLACQQSKIHRHNHTPPTRIPVPDTRFEHVHIDIVGPLPPSKKSNGIIERWHRSLKTALMCHGETQWTDTLPVVLLGLRTCLKEDLGASVAELVYGTTLKVPGEFFSSEEMSSDPRIFVEDFRVIMQKLRPRPTSHHIRPKLFFHKDLYNCSHVFIKVEGNRRPLDQPYTGPHRVLKRISDKVFAIEIDGKSSNVTIDRLKPAYVLVQDSETTSSTASSSSTNIPVQDEPKIYPSPATKRKTVSFKN